MESKRSHLKTVTSVKESIGRNNQLKKDQHEVLANEGENRINGLESIERR